VAFRPRVTPGLAFALRHSFTHVPYLLLDKEHGQHYFQRTFCIGMTYIRAFESSIFDIGIRKEKLKRINEIFNFFGMLLSNVSKLYGL
jgi:hypothetical protein